jgi:hypothetical protein
MKLLISLILIAFTTTLSCQTISNNYTFTSAAEESNFREYENSKSFHLLYYLNNENEDKADLHLKDFYIFLDLINASTSNKREDKRVKVIYKKIHEKYFKKYINSPDFHEIFTINAYNCVTSTALYAIAFDYLKIPYEIKETPNHVYLVVFPKTYRVIFESTSPLEGYKPVNEKQIKGYRDYLISNKLISPDEAKTLDDDQIFSKYYISDSTINLTNLIGIQYYNTSLKYITNDDYKMALGHAEKALKFHNSIYIKDWINLILFDLLNDQIVELPWNEYCMAVKKIIQNNSENREFDSKIIYPLQIYALTTIKKNNGPDNLDSISYCLSNQFTNNNVANEIIYYNNLLLAEYYFKSLEFEKSLYYLEISYRPQDKHLNLLLTECLMKKFGNISIGEKGIDTLNHYERIFPFIKEDPYIQEFGVWCYMKIIYNHFELGEEAEGIKSMNEFRKKYQPNGKAIYNDERIGAGFGAASAFYVRQNNYKKAKEILEEGLKYAPESLELKRKLKLIKDYKHPTELE